MARKSRAGKKQPAREMQPVEPVAEKQEVKQGKTLFEKVMITVFALASLAAVYKGVDYWTGWGDHGKVVKREMLAAEKNSIYKRYDRAIGIYEGIIKRWDGDEKMKEEVKQARLNLAKALKDSERYIEAIEMYKKLADEYAAANRDMYAWLLLETGDCYNSILSKNDAISVYSRVISEFKDSDWAAEALFGIAEAHKNGRDYENAVKYYDMIAEKYKKGFLSAEALTNKAMILEEQGRIRQALSLYEKIVKEFPDIVTEYARLRAEVLGGQTGNK